MSAMDRLNDQIQSDPRNLALHDARYELAVESGDDELLRTVLRDSAKRLENESYVTLIAALEENSDNFVAALHWRLLAVKLRDCRENRSLLERCQSQVVFTRGRHTLEKQRLFYAGDAEMAPILDELEQALQSQDPVEVQKAVEAIVQARVNRRNQSGWGLDP